MKLRPYQNAAVNGLLTYFKRGLRALLLVIPTGGGKTVVFTTIAKRVIAKGKIVMIVCDRKELINQANGNLQRLGLAPTVIAPGYPQHLNNCYLASVDSLRNRELPKVDVIIIDEAHKQTFDKMLTRYKEEGQTPLIIGATATPLRTGSQTSLHEFYEEIIEPTSTAELLRDGYLVPCRTFSVKMDLSTVKVTGNDYNNAALFNEFNKATLYEGMLEQFELRGPTKKTLIFNVNVQHSLNTVDAFRAAGYTAEHLDGNTPKGRREWLLEAYARGEFQILSNCGVLTTGYDEPSIEQIIVNRATKSYCLYSQMAGRGSRLYPGKKDFILIDMAGNCYEHGLWGDAVKWELVKKKRINSGVAPVKICKVCEAMNPTSAKICFDCEAPFPVQKKELLKGEFIEVKATRGLSVEMDFKSATLDQLKAYQKKMSYKNGWARIMFDKQKRGLN